MQRILRLFLLLLAWMALLRPGGAQAQNAGGSFSCDGTFYQVRQSGTGATAFSVLYKVDRSTATYTTTPITGGTFGTTGTLSVSGTRIVVNALAYDSQDGYLYALTYPADNGAATTAAHLFKIGLGGVEDLGATNLPATGQFATGTFDKTGHYYVTTRNSTTTTFRGDLYRFDLNQTGAAILNATIVDMKNSTGGAPTVAATQDYFDLAYDPIDNKMYGVFEDGIIYRLDLYNGTTPTSGNTSTPVPTTARITQLGTTGGTESIGTAFFDIAGNMFAYANGTAGGAATGSFYLVNTSTGAYTKLSTIDGVSNSDGASCINPLQRIDVTKELTNVVAVNATTFDITYTMRVRNTGTVTDNFVQVSDLLKGSGATTANTTFPTATSVTVTAAPTVTNLDGSTLTANTSFTGVSGNASLLSGTQGLTAGQRAVITYTVRVVFPNGAVPSTAQNNTAYATSTGTSPNNGYTQASANGALVTPNNLQANDASTNSSDFAALRSDPNDAGDAASPTPLLFAPGISGVVFEDVNYGGGLGRSQGTSNGVGRPNARVELYNGTTGAYISAMTTAADGSYTFANLTAGASYTVRVVSSSVTSSRNTGNATGLVGVQTYRATATAAAGTTPDLNRVGGEYPARVEAANGASGTLLATLTPLGGTTATESIATVALSTNNAPAVGISFGYNFDTVVNTNNTGQGSLRQFITNANALDNTNLNQDAASTGGGNPAAGVETSIFMIPDGAAHPGLLAYNLTTNPGLASELTNGVAVITPTTALPAIGGTYGANTTIDGTTQTRNVGDTNNATLGVGGTVGTANATLSKVNGPEVQLTGSTAVAFGLDVASTGTNTTIRGLAVVGFGNALDDNAGANIRSAANSLTVTQSVLGSGATAFAQPTTPTNADNLRLTAGTTGISISNNLIGYSNSKGIAVGPTVTNVSITNNEIRSNGLGGANYDGIDIEGATATVTGNLLTGTSGQGVDSYHSAGSNIISGNTITDNGRGTSTIIPFETPGVRIYGANNTISQNIISGNYGAGIMLEGITTNGTIAAVSTTTISQNSIFGNGSVTSRSGGAATGQLGIDLAATSNDEAAGIAPYVTLNSPTTTGANGLLNYPVLTSATVIGTNLVLRGYAKPNATVELFIAQPNALTTITTGNNFGQGRTYLTTLTAGSTGGASYSGPINGFDQGSDTNANAFTFTIPLTTAQQAQVLAGVKLTATSTLSSATSEFSGIVNVNAAPVPNTLTNAGIPNNNQATVLNPNLSGTANGTANGVANSISYYTLTSVPTSGTLTYNGTVLTSANIAATQLTPAQLNTLTYTPTTGFSGNVSFTYTATDANGVTSTTNNSGGTGSTGAATYTIPVTSSSDVTASLTGGTTLSSGQPTGYYTATFSNLGPNPASGVTQSVTLPVDASLTTAQQKAITDAYAGTTFTTASSQVVINFPQATPLASGAANSYRFVFTAPATPGSSTIVATTSTTSSEGANVAANSASLTLNTTAVIDVQATMAASAATVAPGTTASFTATFTNNSTQAAAGVVETVQLPLGLTPSTVSGQAGTTAGTTVTYGTVATLNTTTGLLTYQATTLAGSGTTSSAIAFTMPTNGIVTGTASITTTTTESNTTNNVGSASILAAPRFDLTTTLSGPTAVVAGSPVTLYVTTTNNGPQAIAGAVETVQLPTGLNTTGTPNVFISNGGIYDNTSGKVTFPALGTLPSGQTVANAITFLAPTTAFAPSATVTPNTTAAGETNTANNLAYLNGATSSTSLTPGAATTTTANVYAILSTTSAIVASGTQVTYTGGVGNAGPGTASNVTAQLQLIPGLGASSLTVGGSGGTLAGTTISYPNGATYGTTTGLLSYAAIPLLPSGSSGTATVVVTVPAIVGNNGQLLAAMSVASATSDVVPADNVKEVAVTVQPVSDLATTIAGPASVVPGQSVTYTATFINNGPDAASVAAEAVQLPVGLTTSTLTVGGQTGTLAGTTITFASGATYSTTMGLVTLPAIASEVVGAVQSFNLTFTAPAQSYVVSSSASSATPDSNPANNAASVATAVTPTTDVATAVSGPATAVVGNPVTYVVTSTNNGPGTATSVIPTLQLPAGLTIGAAGPGGFTYDNTTGLLTFPTIGNLQAGVSVENYVTFNMPSATSGQISGVASVSSTTRDNVASNNTAALTTSAASPTTTTADLRTSISPTGTTVAPGSTVVYTVAYRNAAGSAAINVVPTASLPTGLSAATLLVGGVSGTLANSLITFSSGPASGATYDVTTGLLTFPTIASLPVSGTATSYTISLPAPASGQLVVYSAVNSNTTDSDLTNNRANSSIAVSSTFDLTTSITGPVSALVGSQNVYTVTSFNNGPSVVSSARQVVTLPSGLTTSTLLVSGQTGTLAGTTITYSNTGASYNTSTGVLTFATISNLAPGANGAVTNTITVTMPSSGSLTATAAISTTVTGESTTTNNSAAITTVTSPLSLAPVAQNIVNNLRSPEGNTANPLAISPLNATDADGSISNYYIQSLPTAGTLYYNGVAITSIPSGGYQAADATLLSYKPASGFVGNAFFTYTATDNSSVVSPTALYTIPVAQDIASTYAAYNTTKGGATKYVTNDVLAQLTDLNAAIYTSAGIIYDSATGTLQGGAANGLPTTGTNAVLATTGPTGNTSNTLPAGVSLDAATGRIYVSDASQLVNNPTARTYSVLVNTTDANGGISQTLATFTLGAYPLPVVLVEFTAQAVANRDALLSWRTASEQNNDHFEVERSFDGTSFVKIGQLAGHGTTTAASVYAFTDASVAAMATGPVYYRLRQVDPNGTSTYSPQRTVSFTKVALSLSLYPNPVASTTTLDLRQLPASASYQVQLFDATGRQVRTWSLDGGVAQPLELTELASGSYLLVITGTLPSGSLLKQTLRLTKR